MHNFARERPADYIFGKPGRGYQLLLRREKPERADASADEDVSTEPCGLLSFSKMAGDSVSRIAAEFPTRLEGEG